MFSPAERSMRIRLPASSSRMSLMVNTRRSSTASTSSGTPARSPSSSTGVIGQFRVSTLNEVDQILGHGVRGGDHLGGGLIAALVNDEVGELSGHVHVGCFQRAAQNLAAAAG